MGHSQYLSRFSRRIDGGSFDDIASHFCGIDRASSRFMRSAAGRHLLMWKRVNDWPFDSVQNPAIARRIRKEGRATVGIQKSQQRRNQWMYLRSDSPAAKTSFRMGDEPTKATAKSEKTTGVQSVARAIDILEAIADGPLMLAELAARLGLNDRTCYRIASALADRGYLATAGRTGFRLGPKTLELADAFERQRQSKVGVAVPPD
jgi:IclR helix-turn-helix domain